QKTNIENKVKELEEALNGTDLELIKEKKQALEKDAQEIAVKAYEKVQKEHEANNANSDDSNKEKDNTVDAEFEEK
ncbi:MAG: molecular chaperone DnaK, partial [Acholeplasma sp.]|nr:molecular chaperone DnaK [Acholeplasma sp.]